MTIHVFRYSQLIDTDRMRTIEAFAEKSGLSKEVIGKIALAEEKKGGLISQYKSGGIDTIEFRTELQELIKNKDGRQLEDNVFDDCWNAMCRVDSIKFKELHQFQLEHENCKIHIIGDTNELQHKFIGKQIALLEKKPEITYTLSFEEHLDRDELAELVEKAYPDVGIVWHYLDEGNILELLARYYQYYDSSEESSLVEQDITAKVVEDSTNESSKSLVEDTIDVMGGLELSSSNPDSVE